MKVDFIIIGAQKCATTTLFAILTRHPRIVGSRVKEPHFFSTSPDWRAELARYEALFDERPGALYGEASTSYTFYPHRNLRIWDDLFAYNPAMRLIYVVRHPVERILSSYVHHVARGFTREPIERVVRSHALLLDATRYYTQVIPYVRRFGRERVLLLDFDDLVRRRRDTLERTAGFLGVDVDGLGEFEAVHANRSVGERKQHYLFDDPPRVVRGVRSLVPGLWERVVDRLSPHVTERPLLPADFQEMILHVLDLEIRALEELMEKDLSHWRTVIEPFPGACESAAQPEESVSMRLSS